VIFWVVAFVALGVAAALLGFIARSAPPLGGRVDAKILPTAPPGGDAARAELASFVPTTGAIVGALPAVDARALLTPLPPEAAATVDLSLVGVHDDRDAADRELWRTARKALAAKATDA
jgi:hypothetical protein